MKHSYIDQHSQIDSFIHRVDPRVKIIVTVSLILFLILTPPIFFTSFLLYAMLILLLILLSRVPLLFIFQKSLIIIPFVLLIGIFIPFLKKGEIAGAYSFGSFNITVTYSGLMVFWNVFVKSYLSALSMILLISTVKFSDFLKAVENLRLPRIFIMILSFMYRYAFLMIDEFEKMHQAKEARSINGRRWVHIKAFANMIGMLFVRAYERGEKVYMAMCSRGFTGQIRTINSFKIKISDLCFLFVTVSLLGLIRFMGG